MNENDIFQDKVTNGISQTCVNTTKNEKILHCVYSRDEHTAYRDVFSGNDVGMSINAVKLV